MSHLLSVNDLSEERINSIFSWADDEECRIGLPHKIMVSFFAEPSTRTRLSFEAAMHKLGGNVITAADASVSSSLAKGESLKDTFKTLSKYADVIVFRHKDEKWPDEARKWSTVPVINAGNGGGEHPTQALLDLYTIKQRLKRFDGLNVLFCGDLKYGRTVNSLISLLSRYGCKIYVCPTWIMKMGFLGQFERTERLLQVPGILVEQENIQEILPKIDVLYMTRVQSERMNPRHGFDSFTMTREMAEMMKMESIIMHPLPRNEELEEEVDYNPRAVYFDQIENGLAVRMALLRHIFSK